MLVGAAGAVVTIVMAAGLAYWIGRKAISVGLVLVAATVGLAAWPTTREPLLAMFASAQEPSPLAAFPTSLPALPTTRPSRMPANHPDISAPRSGPHFSCHQNNPRQNQAHAEPLPNRE